jgi:hypothetical protein
LYCEQHDADELVWDALVELCEAAEETIAGKGADDLALSSASALHDRRGRSPSD